MPDMHEIDYKIFGDDMQFVEVELDPNEATVAEAGGMMYMEDGIEMETIFGDGSKQSQGGFLGALMGAGKRLLTGESLFMTVFLNRSGQKKRLAFGAPYPGKIIPIHLAEIGGELIAQKDSFLAAAKGVIDRHRVPAQARRRAVRRRRLHHAAAAGRRLGVRPRRRHAPGAHARGPAKSSASTPAASSRSSRRSTTTSSTSARSSRRSSAARACSSRRCAGPGRVWLQSLPLSRLANRIIAAVPGLGARRPRGRLDPRRSRRTARRRQQLSASQEGAGRTATALQTVVSGFRLRNATADSPKPWRRRSAGPRLRVRQILFQRRET